MSTYRRPKATGPTYRFEAVGPDRFSPHSGTPVDGTEVRIMHPGGGCPPNGTMGHVYVEDAATGDFYGLVFRRSLHQILHIRNPATKRAYCGTDVRPVWRGRRIGEHWCAECCELEPPPYAEPKEVRHART